MTDLRTLARALGGEVSESQVLVPGPGHSKRDRSLSIRLSASSRDCRDYVRERLAENREVNLLRSDTPGDLNDALRGAA